MRWKEESYQCCLPVHGVRTWRCCLDYQQQWHTLDLASGGRPGGTGKVAGQSWLLRRQHVAQDLQSQLHVFRAGDFVLRSKIAGEKGVLMPSTRRACRLRFILTSGDLVRLLEAYWCHCGPTAQETHSITRADSGYETCSYCCLADVELPERCKGRRYWEQSVTWRCEELWRDEYIRLSKEDYRNNTQGKRPLPGRPNNWEHPFTLSWATLGYRS